MPLIDIRIDDALWDAGSPGRRYEWRQAATDLLEEHEAVADRLKLRVALAGSDTLLAATTSDGELFAHVILSASILTPHFKEYIAICKEMGKLGEGTLSPRLEALDIAKRIAHDEAGETLRGLTRPLGLNHGGCRRLFTLLITLHFDTTRLLLPHHRR